MKIKLDHGYMKKIKYITLGFVIIYIIYLVMTNIGDVINGVSDAFSFIVKILSPFLWGLVIAYLLNPIVRYFEKIISKIKINKKWERTHRKQKKAIVRGISLVLTLVSIITILTLLVNSVFVMINGSFRDFKITELIKEITDTFENYSKELGGIEESLNKMGIAANITQFLKELSISIINQIKEIATSITARVTTIGRYIIDISFGFVFAFNFIMNKEYFHNLLENALRLTLNDKRKNSLKEILHEINIVFLSFIRGKIIDLTLLSFVTVISLIIIQFDYAFIVGTFAGYTNIIPYLGTWIGIIPAVIIALVKDGWQEALFVGAYIVIIQQVYYVFVSPKIQGKSIGMHPVFILLAMFVFGKFFGLLGVILSIPMGGIVKIFINRWTKRRQDKKNIVLIDLKK
ncbi:AI-2E family transporter [Vallitalea guaymasensis]|uniref:AI-2E family transporter n=1 Tax=Vallitalea guaymasensis TaxID=1185412 RepID=A0A8J8MA82_9FIRM|nr:AI-2E family transporter [Vallitalea guaymasensis]QUH29134.1 AI-2E family transporter [Vallitalea guaymasensis]